LEGFLARLRPLRFGLRKPTSGHYVVAAATIALLMAGVVLPSPLYNLYRREFALTPGEISVVFAIYAVSLIPSLVFLGGISDAIGRRRTMLMGVALLGLGSLVLAFADGLIWLLIARLLQGFAAGITLSAAIAALTEWLPGQRRKQAGAIAVVSTSVGSGFGALLGGSLGQYVSHGPMLAYLVHTALLAVLSASIAMTPSYPHVHPPHSSLISVPASIRIPFLLASSETFIGWGTVGLFISLVPSFLDATLKVSNLMLGAAVIVLIQLAVVPASLAGSKLSNRVAIITAMLALGIGVWSLILSTSLHLLGLIALAALCVGCGYGLSYLAGLRIIENIAPPRERAEVTSAFLLSCYVGFTLPTLAIGIAADGFGFYQAIVSAAVLLGIIAIAIMIFARDRYLAPSAQE
jgi:MFS family permease